MKHFFKIVLTLSLLTAVFVSCGSDDDGLTFSAGYGTVETSELGSVPGRYFAIRLDNGTLLVSMGTLVPINQLENNDRVLVNYTVLGNVVVSDNKARSYYVRINNYDKRLSKLPVRQSEIGLYPEEGETEYTLGNDPVRVTSAWLGGRYINIELAFMREQWGSVKHYMNLVYNDIDVEYSEEGGVERYEFMLRHNGYSDVPTAGNIGMFVFSAGFISFDIASTMQGQENKLVDVSLIWYDYNTNPLAEPVRMENRGVFKFSNGRFEEVKQVSAYSADGDTAAYIK